VTVSWHVYMYTLCSNMGWHNTPHICIYALHTYYNKYIHIHITYTNKYIHEYIRIYIQQIYSYMYYIYVLHIYIHMYITYTYYIYYDMSRMYYVMCTCTPCVVTWDGWQRLVHTHDLTMTHWCAWLAPEEKEEERVFETTSWCLLVRTPLWSTITYHIIFSTRYTRRESLRRRIFGLCRTNCCVHYYVHKCLYIHTYIYIYIYIHVLNTYACMYV